MAGPRVTPLADGGELLLWPVWMDASDAAACFETLRNELAWQHLPIRIAGKEILQPRLTAWTGDPEAIYTYSGVVNRPAAWTVTLARLRLRLHAELGTRFNSVLANYYRDERDSMGWHADNEPELGENPIIASLSFGATRRFVLAHRKRKDERVELALGSGSLLVMRGTTQRFWRHSVPKERAPMRGRINLTFRVVARA